MRNFEGVDDDALRDYFVNLRRGWDIAAADSDMTTLESLQAEVPRTQEEMRRRGI